MKKAEFSAFFICAVLGTKNACLTRARNEKPMSDIFRDVDEALSREKAAKFWKDYGPRLITAAIILVATTGAITAYKNWESWRNKQETAKLVAATNSEDMAAAMQSAAQDTRGSHKAIALMNAAAEQSEAKNFKEAASLYKSVAEDGSAPDELQDLAAILYTRSAVLAAGEAAPDYTALLDSVLPVAKDDKSAFQPQAKLESALLYGDGLKDYTSALALLKGLEDENIPDSLKEKATALSHVYSYEQSRQPTQE